MADNNKDHSELGITQEYTGNRDRWDSAAAKKKFKDEKFGDKNTITDKDGVILHKSHNAAKNKYHHKNADGKIVSSSYAKHAAETDHIVPLEEIHKIAKHNPLLSDGDLKEIANIYDNYQILSKSTNASKGAKKSLNIKAHAHLQAEFAKTTLSNTKKLVVDSTSEAVTKIRSETVKKGKIVAGSVAEAGTEVIEGAGEAAKSAAMIAMLDGLKRVIIDGESVDDTLVYEAKAVASAAIVGKGEEFLIKAATNIFAKSGNEVLKSIVEQNAIGQIFVLGAAVGMATMKYLDGKITAKELAEEIVLNGAIIGISTLLTSFIPIPFLGPVISGIAVNALNLINQARKQIDNCLEHMNDYLIKERAIRRLSNEAVAEMERQRRKFNELVKEDLDKWDRTVELAFDKIISGADYDNFDVNSIVDGLDTVLSLCGSSARFHSVEEWESQLDMPLELSF